VEATSIRDLNLKIGFKYIIIAVKNIFNRALIQYIHSQSRGAAPHKWSSPRCILNSSLSSAASITPRSSITHAPRCPHLATPRPFPLPTSDALSTVRVRSHPAGIAVVGVRSHPAWRCSQRKARSGTRRNHWWEPFDEEDEEAGARDLEGGRGGGAVRRGRRWRGDPISRLH
jgi:hypothetical protein